MKKDFEQYGFDPSVGGADNPWGAALPERRDTDAPVRYTRPLLRRPAVRIVAIVLLVAFTLYLLWAVFVHPINKLKLRLLVTQSCTMTVYAQYYHQGVLQAATAVVRVDGDLIATASSEYSKPEGWTYYRLDGDEVYVYEPTLGTWADGTVALGDIGIMSDEYETLLDRRSYERVKGRLFRWQLKDGVDVQGMWNVQFGREAGRLALTWNEAGVKYTITFKAFGTTRVELPREE